MKLILSHWCGATRHFCHLIHATASFCCLICHSTTQIPRDFIKKMCDFFKLHVWSKTRTEPFPLLRAQSCLVTGPSLSAEVHTEVLHAKHVRNRPFRPFPFKQFLPIVFFAYPLYLQASLSYQHPGGRLSINLYFFNSFSDFIEFF